MSSTACATQPRPVVVASWSHHVHSPVQEKGVYCAGLARFFRSGIFRPEETTFFHPEETSFFHFFRKKWKKLKNCDKNC